MKKVVKKSFGKTVTHIGRFKDLDSDNDSTLGTQEMLQENDEVTTECSTIPIDDKCTNTAYEKPQSFVYTTKLDATINKNRNI